MATHELKIKGNRKECTRVFETLLWLQKNGYPMNLPVNGKEAVIHRLTAANILTDALKLKNHHFNIFAAHGMKITLCKEGEMKCEMFGGEDGFIEFGTETVFYKSDLKGDFEYGLSLAQRTVCTLQHIVTGAFMKEKINGNFYSIFSAGMFQFFDSGKAGTDKKDFHVGALNSEGKSVYACNELELQKIVADLHEGIISGKVKLNRQTGYGYDIFQRIIK
jgi:hypothetical protein